jgi:erythromycin esterase-like protein
LAWPEIYGGLGHPARRVHDAADGRRPGTDRGLGIRTEAIPVKDGVPADGVLFALVGDAHFVLIGEASHGTNEFYAARAQMTRRLIEERGFVAAEADWPDAYRVNRFVRGRGEDATAEEALRGFQRFPTWTWCNAAVLVRPALADSYEELFHEVGHKEFLISFPAAPQASEVLRSARLERAIGLIYRPQTQRQSHYSAPSWPTSSAP